MTSAKTLETYQQKQLNLTKNIERIKVLVDESASGEKVLSAAELRCRLDILEIYFKQAISNQSNIEQFAPDDNDDGFATLEDLYVATKLAIQHQLGDEFRHHQPAAESTIAFTTLNSKLPSLKLPTFSGKYSDYKNFIASFSQIIDREANLSNIEKFNHLLNCLRGQALETVKAYQITDENYPKALDRLKSRYDNSTLIFLENITALFELPRVIGQNSSLLRSLIDNASALYGSLSSLGNDKQIANAMLIHLVIQKVDETSRKKWQESLNFVKLPTWDECSSLLERRCQHLESMSTPGQQQVENRQEDHHKVKKIQKKQYSFACAKRICSFCSSPDHFIAYCQKFKSLNIADRYSNAKRLQICFNCLSKSHQVSNCNSPHKCKTCNNSHHTLLHQTLNAFDEAAASTSATAVVQSVHSHYTHSSSDQIMLATALVLVQNSSGGFELGRALLDSCSQVNLMTDAFSQSLQLPKKKQHTTILSIGDANTNIKHNTFTTIRSRFTTFEYSAAFCITSHISYQPESDVDISSWNLPQNAELADERFFASKRIDLLLGADSFFEILSVGQIKLGNNLPVLQKTLFGWVVSGRCAVGPSKYHHSFMTFSDQSINANLEKLWNLEEVESKPIRYTEGQEACERYFKQTTLRNLDGRVVVRLPFKNDSPNLGSSYNTALRRFAAQERRLDKEPELKIQYSNFMKEYEDLGHMEIMPNPNLDELHYYIPHHCVFKPSSTTTKLRVVFDASSTSSSHRSLNDNLLIGPTIQEELYNLLLRFRLFKYVLTADIVKMYRQVLIDERDRRFQYILWRYSAEEKIKTYRLNTVTYGTSAAPYLAIRSLHYLADQHESQYPLGSNIIKTCFYVDDLLCGANSIKELSQIKAEVTKILANGAMQLSKWHSNLSEFVEDTSLKPLNDEKDSITSALGITWDQSSDKFMFCFKPEDDKNSRPTKRSILSIASSLFDPLGLLSPLIIVAKILLQELWLLKLQWDESVPQNLHTAWQNFLVDMQSLPTINIPRFCLNGVTTVVEVHGFCDSSIRAYGGCIYLRTQDPTGSYCVRLFTSKSKVAPTKKKSLPKLELCGAHLLARLYNKIIPLLTPFCISRIYLWTDSQIVLHWLTVHSATLSAFVGNRISEIQDLTSSCEWRHVPSQHNPADLLSRGATVDKLMNSIWLTGPVFLQKSSEFWPVLKRDEFQVDINEINKEKRKSIFHASQTSNFLLSSLERCRSYLLMVRTTATMFRFINRISHRQEIVQPVLTPQELEKALACICWNLQQQYFTAELKLLQRNEPMQGPLKYLNPFIDTVESFELIKVGGRLRFANIAEGQKHPIILPSKSIFVERYVRYIHESNFHAGPKALQAIICQRFWIINSRQLVRRIVHDCILCVRYRPRLQQQIMGDLPMQRITPARPFSRCAIDFCGPVNTYLRIRGKAPYKTYIAVFVCLAVKAVHIEIVSDLTSDAFIAALKRMIARRGLPSEIFCDNATNFVGASTKLKELKAFLFSKTTQNEISNFCTNQFINFIFIPPRAPHFGGLWEAAVKSAKSLLNRTLSNVRLTYEELNTAMVEIESILNSRPISPLSTDPSDYEALTPGHFLIGSSMKALPERTMHCKEIENLEKWSRITAIKQRFWHRWSADYINSLQTRSKWTENKANVKAGSLVLIHEDNVSPMHWVMGRITSAIPGKDQQIRVVDVKTSKGVIRRPIHKIALLPA